MNKVKFTKLFSRFDYEIELKESGLTIITGPNGFGKSTILKTISCLSIGFSEIGFFLNLNFERIELFFNEKTICRLEKKDKILSINDITIDTEAIPEDLKKELDRKSSYIKIRDDLWLNRKNGEVIKYNDIFFETYLSNTENIDDAKKIRAIFENINNEIGKIFYLSEQRLIKQIYNPRDENISYKDTLDELPEKLKRIISSVQRDYSELSYELDSTYPFRLFENSEKITKKEFDNNLKDMLAKYEKLCKYSLASKSLSSTKKLSFNDEYAKALKIYFEDFSNKYSIYDDLIKKLDLYTEIVNSRLTFKSIEVTKDDGLIVKDEDNPEHTIQLSQLSSGEKQEIVMFFDLIFGYKDKSLLLIDEPEISLHIMWQKKFIEDLIKIIDYKKINVIVATHSPQIINNRWENQIDLGELYGKQLNSK